MTIARFIGNCARGRRCYLGERIMPNDQIVRTRAGWVHQECVQAARSEESVDPRLGRVIADVARLGAKVDRLMDEIDKVDDRVDAVSDDKGVPGWSDRVVVQERPIHVQACRDIIIASLYDVYNRTSSDFIRGRCDTIRAALHQITGD